MDGRAKVLSPSPEEAAFRHYYDDFLQNVTNPIQFAELLLQEGIIGNETKDRITSNEDEEQKRVLLDSVQQALKQSKNKSRVLLKASTALENSCDLTGVFDAMDSFIDGEYSTVPFKT